MSHSMVPLNIVSALVKAEDMLGKERVWQALNKEQERFLRDFFSRRENLSAFSPSELRAWVDTVAERLNKILKDEGFDIQLEDFADGEFGVVSILDVLVEWIKEGRQTEIQAADNARYPAVRFSESTENVEGGGRVVVYEAFTVNGSPNPIVRLNTKSGDTVAMTIADGEASGFTLIEKIDALRTATSQPIYPDSFTFPMVDYNQSKTLSWLLGLATQAANGKGYEGSEALSQTKFKMNHLGARLKDAVAIAIRTTSFRQRMNIVIDRPFYLWIERPGVPAPVFYAYFDQADWKNPGSLSSI